MYAPDEFILDELRQALGGPTVDLIRGLITKSGVWLPNPWFGHQIRGLVTKSLVWSPNPWFGNFFGAFYICFRKRTQKLQIH